MAGFKGILLVLMLAACSSPEMAVDPRTAAERGSPDLEQWRAGSAAIAQTLSERLPRGSMINLTADMPDAPDYFRDLLVQQFLSRGISVADQTNAAGGGGQVTVHCRTMPVGVADRPRGVELMAKTKSGIVIFCSAARAGAYVAATDHFLPSRADTAPADSGIVLGVTQ